MDEENVINKLEAAGKGVHLTRKNSNSHFLPPMGLVVVFCTMMLVGRSIRQNYFCAYSVTVGQELLAAATPSISNEAKHETLQEDNIKLLINDEKINNLKNKPTESKTEDIIETEHPKHEQPLKLSETVKIAHNYEQVETNEAINKMNIPREESTESANKIDNANNLNKQRTSEPIIYLFVFVFIYLLLKSVADINSHYKTKMNGDTRLRRHSLQSYAQIHRYDNPRRASRGIGARTFPKFY